MNNAVADGVEPGEFEDISDEKSGVSSFTSQYAVLFHLFLSSVVKTATAHRSL